MPHPPDDAGGDPRNSRPNDRPDMNLADGWNMRRLRDHSPLRFTEFPQTARAGFRWLHALALGAAALVAAGIIYLQHERAPAESNPGNGIASPTEVSDVPGNKPPPTAPSSSPNGEIPETFYVHGTVTVRTGADRAYPLVTTLDHGEQALLGERNPSGWAKVYDDSTLVVVGWVHFDSVALGYDRPADARFVAPPHPAGANALCRDESYSFRSTRGGSCGWHDGVRQWIGPP